MNYIRLIQFHVVCAFPLIGFYITKDRNEACSVVLEEASQHADSIPVYAEISITYFYKQTWKSVVYCF